MSRDQNAARLATLALASGLLGTTAAVRPVFLPLAILGPVALWWRYDRLERALLFGWIPALWAGLAVQLWTTAAHPDPLSYVFFAGLATVVGLILAGQLLRLRPWLADRLPHGRNQMLRIAEGGPRALATLYPQGGHILARGAQSRGLVVGRPDTHTLVVGPTRAGKSSSEVIPNVMAWTAGAVVAVSTKPDVLDAAGPTRATLGQVSVLDVLGTLDRRRLPTAVQRVRWTPLRGCTDWNTARARARALLGPARTTPSVTEAGHWATQGELLLAPLLHAAAACGLTLREVTTWATAGSPAQLEEALGLLHELDAREAHAQLRGVLHQEPRHRSSVISTVTTALHPYSGHILDEAAMAKDSDWDPDAFLAGTNTLLVIAPVDSEVDTPAPIVVGVLSELYSAVRRISDAAGGRLPHPSLWALDEVAGICPLPALPQWMAEAAGRGLSFLLGVQDYAQLAARWGKDGATAMWSNATNKVVFPGISNPDTLRQLELLGGTQWLLQVTTSTSQQQLPRWTADTLYAMPATSCLVVRPDWPHPSLQPQSRAYLTQPFAMWQRMPWPAEDGELMIIGSAMESAAPSVPTPPP